MSQKKKVKSEISSNIDSFNNFQDKNHEDVSMSFILWEMHVHVMLNANNLCKRKKHLPARSPS